MLIVVTKVLELTSGPRLETTFSAIPTKRHLQRDPLKQVHDGGFGGFHRFTALITTTSFILSEHKNFPVVLIAAVDRSV